MNTLIFTSKIHALAIVLAAVLLSSVDSYGIERAVRDSGAMSRRNLLLQTTKTVAVITVSGASTMLPFAAASADAATGNEIAACPPRSQNCIRAKWTAPTGIKDVTAAVLDLFKSYPLEGQGDIDKGGWTVVKDGSNGDVIRLEFKSGVGNFAKFFNGGKPFVDDVTILVTGNAIDIRSASRIGESDLGVNQKRLQFLVAKARAMGWDVPDPIY